MYLSIICCALRLCVVVYECALCMCVLRCWSAPRALLSHRFGNQTGWYRIVATEHNSGPARLVECVFAACIYFGCSYVFFLSFGNKHHSRNILATERVVFHIKSNHRTKCSRAFASGVSSVIHVSGVFFGANDFIPRFNSDIADAQNDLDIQQIIDSGQFVDILFVLN